jgi:urea transport system permease protein
MKSSNRLSRIRELADASIDIGRVGRVRYATLAILAIAIVFPFVTGRFQTGLMLKFYIFAMFALSLDLLWGYAGILSLGHAGFFGLGAYVMALTLIHVDSPGAIYLAVLGATVVPALLAAFVGYLLFYGRVSGMYFGVISLIVSIILNQLVITLIEYTGGLNGLYPIPPLRIYVPGLVNLEIVGETPLYFAMLVCLVTMFVFCRWIVGSGFGRLMGAIKGNDTRTEFFGYHLANSKIAVFSLTCALAGLAGGLYASAINFISPDILGINMTTEVLVWVAVGGRGTLVGPILGAILVNSMALFLSGEIVDLWYLIMGAFLVAIVLFRPTGIMGYFAKES